MITFLTLLLIFICVVVVILIMIQRTSGGMGSALGGGTADQVLGAGSAAQLTKMTVWGILGFFVLSFTLYALYQGEAADADQLQRTGDDTPVLQPETGPTGNAGISDTLVPDATNQESPALPPSPGNAPEPVESPAPDGVEKPGADQPGKLVEPGQPSPPEANSSQ
jgi:preprotein translocase subunit SecG